MKVKLRNCSKTPLILASSTGIAGLIAAYFKLYHEMMDCILNYTNSIYQFKKCLSTTRDCCTNNILQISKFVHIAEICDSQMKAFNKDQLEYESNIYFIIKSVKQP
ncbi:LOW QUALITY PROTEIN: hypothetical protein MXB_1028 [Myxobolus squamalis]|nr:LOW QUALITY PROTEIN: hypothetical protein MXB_1028 [Myxobolus squamalis]